MITKQCGVTQWKNEKFSLNKKILRQINSLVTYLVKPLLSRNFCQRSRNFLTFLLLKVILIFMKSLSLQIQEFWEMSVAILEQERSLKLTCLRNMWLHVKYTANVIFKISCVMLYLTRNYMDFTHWTSQLLKLCNKFIQKTIICLSQLALHGSIDFHIW